jgi:cytochrome b pre-mRNA-processing protein 3
LAWFFARKPRIGDAHYALYAAIVAQSRQAFLYADWGVPDTLTGRFDMVSLHLALVLRRLQAEGVRCRDFSQGLFDLFFKDMDRTLREMGVGDISVPKRIEKMGSLFYGLVEGLGQALDATGDATALEAFVVRDVLSDEAITHAPELAAYVRRLADRLATLPAETLMAGELHWTEAA